MREALVRSIAGQVFDPLPVGLIPLSVFTAAGQRGYLVTKAKVTSGTGTITTGDLELGYLDTGV